jgi:hypothetical protein
LWRRQLARLRPPLGSPLVEAAIEHCHAVHMPLFWS